MSQYTIVNFMPESGDTQDWIDYFEANSDSRFIRKRRNGKTILLRYGGDKRDKIENSMIGEKNGYIIYDAPIHIRSTESETLLGYLVIDYYEDTGDHHESTLYKVIAFERADRLDRTRIDDDRLGEKLDEYYDENYRLKTSIDPP